MGHFGIEQRAQIVEMALRAAAFLKLAVAPLGDEIVRGHAQGLTRARANKKPRRSEPAGLFISSTLTPERGEDTQGCKLAC